ncbi:hypothetical protein L914_05140 [Phytophthora nicotianae]|uniref:DDE Tnp4 domain-containing protein n=1 Tax=Phytophthora nicotianae TaxID=4792 RepID=W2NQX3_PHYNI|nr:hypothetical protein L914_05140 [Phytophthora nicotianae]
MAADELVLLCAILDDAGCNVVMPLVIAALYNPPAECTVVPNIRFCLASTADADAAFDFRFDVESIMSMASLFKLSDRLSRDIAAACTKQKLCAHYYIDLAILSALWICGTFGRSEDTLYFNKQIFQSRTAEYADAIQRKESPMKSNFSFIDGTKNAVCRPSPRPIGIENLQRQVHSGHKRIHSLNYQCITTPDGLSLH